MARINEQPDGSDIDGIIDIDSANLQPDGSDAGIILDIDRAELHSVPTSTISADLQSMPTQCINNLK
jgi:hypothetical protein